MVIYPNFITFEGGDGSGKTTQVNLLCDYLKRNNIDYCLVREPGGTKISEEIRAILADVKNDRMTARSAALLFAAAREQVLEEIILPQLKTGKLVIGDRYFDSSLAYQGYGEKLPQKFLKIINERAFLSCVPICTFLLRITPLKAFNRKGGQNAQERVELRTLDYHYKVYQGYLKLAQKFKQRFCCLDGMLSVDTIQKNIIKKLQELGILSV